MTLLEVCVKRLGVLGMILSLAGCGFSSRNNELTGQVKKVMHNTPLICPDFFDADVSLGVMRNGVGSMSSQDRWLFAPRESDQEIFKKAAESGAIVKVTYDTRRLAICTEEEVVTKVEIIP